jgi:hypothetical protein
MDEIRAIVDKARAKRGRRTQLRARPAEEEEEDGERSDNSVSDTEEDEAFAVIPQVPARKTPKQKWLADTGASAHMTDQLSLFRGLLKEVKGRAVYGAGEVKLRVKGRGSVQVQIEGGVMNLLNVLYVSDL